MNPPQNLTPQAFPLPPPEVGARRPVQSPDESEPEPERGRSNCSQFSSMSRIPSSCIASSVVLSSNAIPSRVGEERDAPPEEYLATCAANSEASELADAARGKRLANWDADGNGLGELVPTDVVEGAEAPTPLVMPRPLLQRPSCACDSALGS